MIHFHAASRTLTNAGSVVHFTHALQMSSSHPTRDFVENPYAKYKRCDVDDRSAHSVLENVKSRDIF
jgi:hypothetical protein